MSNAPRNAAANRDWGHDERGCTMLHIDMDAFFASLEIARHPEIAGKPVIIGTGPRAVVSAANYEARKYGINSAMAAARAHQLCPDGVFLPVDGAYYRQVSRQIFTDIFSQVTDAIEQVSVDECYMDVSGALLRWGSPRASAPGYANKCPSDSTSPARWAWHATNSWRKWPPRTPNRTACCSSQQANTTLLCR